MALYLDPLTAAGIVRLDPMQEVTLLGFDVVKVANAPAPASKLLAVVGFRHDATRAKFWGFEFNPVAPEDAAEMTIPELLVALFGDVQLVEVQKVDALRRVEYVRPAPPEELQPVPLEEGP